MKTFYILFFLFTISVTAKIQDSTSVQESIIIIYDLDSTREIRKFTPQTIQEYKEDQDFSYVELEVSENSWTQFKNWIGQILKRFYEWLFGTTELSGFWSIFLKIIPYIIVIAVLSLLGWLFMRVNPKEVLGEQQIGPQVILTEEEDIIQNQDIEQLIEKALQDHNYRLAIRYYYLRVLKKLSDAEYIEWEPQKTNTDYIKELNDNSLKKQFRNITRLYDFIWYGSFEVDEKSYHTAVQKFKSLTNSLNI